MFIYALIRTCNRPKLFERCYNSVLRSTVKITPIIVYDGDEKPNHVPDDVISFPATKVNRIGCFYNLYCNDLLMEVSKYPEGYFFFLDDDDYIQDSNSIKRILPYLDPEKANICQFMRNHKTKPNNTMIARKQIVSGMIGLPCIILNNKFANIATFNSSSNADYQYIRDVSERIETKFIARAIVMSPTRSHGALYVG